MQTQAEKTAYMRLWRAKNIERARYHARRSARKVYASPKRIAYTKAWRKKNLHRIKWYGLKTKLGVTKEHYYAMYMQQNGRCSICKTLLKDVRDHVDHDHLTQKIRGILCELCNKGLGQFKDSVERLEAAALYLKESR